MLSSETVTTCKMSTHVAEHWSSSESTRDRGTGMHEEEQGASTNVMKPSIKADDKVFQKERETHNLFGFNDDSSSEEEDLPQPDISTPGHLIKEEPNTMDMDCSTQKWHIKHQSAAVKDEPLADEERSLMSTNMSTCTGNLYRPIKVEPCEAATSTPGQQSFAIKEESLSSEDDDSASPQPGFVHSFSQSRNNMTDDPTSKQSYSCPVCKRVFSCHGNLSRHRETHKGVKMSCSTCGADFCNKMDLAAHAKIEHSSSKATYVCPVCKRTFNAHANVVRHREAHKGVKMSCSTCGADFCNKSDLAAHAKVEHSSSKATYVCPVCKRTFSTHANAMRHRETHAPKTMSCKECGADFCNKANLATHTRMHRASGVSYRSSDTTCTCPVCKRVFNSQANFIKHSETHKGVRVSCLQCGADFCNKTDLKAHTRKHRAGNVSCSDPNATFPRLANLTGHKGVKMFGCPHCKKLFTRESSLAEHIKGHTMVKAFSCFVCNKAYAREEDLLNHQRTHEEETMIICSECGLTFVDQDTLDRHLRFHKLHKPFSCDLCKKHFVHKTELVRHERTHVH